MSVFLKNWQANKMAEQDKAFKSQYGDPLSRINPSYTQSRNIDAMAPMQMYQDYMRTGQAENVPGQYQQFTPAPQSPVYQPATTSGLAGLMSSLGGQGGK